MLALKGEVARTGDELSKTDVRRFHLLATPHGRFRVQVRAAALAALAALTMHPMEQAGDECLYGHHRVALLRRGFFGRVLQAVEPAPLHVVAAELAGECASVTLMNLSTMVTDEVSACG